MKTKAKVLVEALDDAHLDVHFARAAEYLELGTALQSARSVFIKPNLTYPRFKEGVTTRKRFVEALIRTMVRFNRELEIVIGESDGGYNSFSIDETYRNMQFHDLEREFGRVRIVNLSRLPSREIQIDTVRGPYRISVPSIFFDRIDFSITCPVPKVHCMTTLTLAFKNQWGCLPDVMRLKNHYMFNHLIAGISDILKFRYAFLDGRYGLDDNGPMVGTPVETDWFAASDSLGAFDCVVAKMMGFSWRKVGHLKQASRYGLIPGENEIEVRGDVARLARKFRLHRTFWNYPALAAFHSRHLTQLFYFSGVSELLHDFMYTFRKRPITP
jgi:uncharacterized protein (DUF362 family)